MDNHTAGVDLDRLQAIADRLDERGSFATSAELREMINLARRAQPRVTEQADERALFEQCEPGLHLARKPDGDYENPFVQSAWNGWQYRAALIQAAPEAPAWKHAPDPCDDCSGLCHDCPYDIDRDTTAPAAQQAGADYSDPTLACSSCGLTIGESRTLGHIQLGILTTSAATTASASIDTMEFRKLLMACRRAEGSFAYSDAVEAVIKHVDGRAPAPRREAAPLDASELLEAAMKDAYDWIGECVQAGRQPGKSESDARIVKFIVDRAALAQQHATVSRENGNGET